MISHIYISTCLKLGSFFLTSLRAQVNLKIDTFAKSIVETPECDCRRKQKQGWGMLLLFPPDSSNARSKIVDREWKNKN